MSGADRVQQARERAEATLNAEWFEPVGVTMRENLAHDVLFLADRVATLETALRLVPVDDWQEYADEDLLDLINTYDMQDFLSAVRAALAGPEEASA